MLSSLNVSAFGRYDLHTSNYIVAKINVISYCLHISTEYLNRHYIKLLFQVQSKMYLLTIICKYGIEWIAYNNLSQTSHKIYFFNSILSRTELVFLKPEHRKQHILIAFSPLMLRQRSLFVITQYARQFTF